MTSGAQGPQTEPRIPDDTLRALVQEGLEEIEHTESHIMAYALADWLTARGVRLHHTGHTGGWPAFAFTNRGWLYRLGRRVRALLLGRCHACSAILSWNRHCPYADGNADD